MGTIVKYIFKESVLFEIEVNFLFEIEVVQNIGRFRSAAKVDHFQYCLISRKAEIAQAGIEIHNKTDENLVGRVLYFSLVNVSAVDFIGVF